MLPPIFGPGAGAAGSTPDDTRLRLHEREYFSTRGAEVLVFNNAYEGEFSDAKISGIELIHHGVRTATNGDVRLSATPEQWDAVPTLRERRVDTARGVIVARLAYPEHNFNYTVEVEPRGAGAVLRVLLDAPLPAGLVGRAGFNLEFLPSAYFSRTYLMDATSGVVPLHPTAPPRRPQRTGASVGEPGAAPRRSPVTGLADVVAPLATGRTLSLAPEDPERHVTIEAQRGGDLALFDGRLLAQNGWLVVRTPLPEGATGTVVEWTLAASTIPEWTRPPVIAHSQVGYHPGQRKVAVIECDRNGAPPGPVRLLHATADGRLNEVLAGEPQHWGDYLRYVYYTFDFTNVREPGIYVLKAGDVRTHAFRVAKDIYADAWQPTLDVFLPVQMDHMFVNEGYRVWHGLSHMDDARQAPPNHQHFDLYAHGAEIDSPFDPGEHIPGLAVGGWFDAGDFDLRTQTHFGVIQALVHTWEKFRPLRDETLVDQERRHVELHQPDGQPDILQQIEHGTLFLLAQHRVFGHAIPGVVEPDLGQYTHLGDAVTKTDGRIHDPADPNSPADDRWAFTTATTALNYGSAATLAAASRALRGYDDALAEECLATAQRIWTFEQGREPNLFQHGNTTGGHPLDEELDAAVELLITTANASYAQRVRELWPQVQERFLFNVVSLLRALPHMDRSFADEVRARARAYRDEAVRSGGENPFGVPISRGSWAGNGLVVAVGIARYYLHEAFPEEFPADDVLRSLEYLHGCHPGSDISFVSGVGTRSQQVAYGSNRADFSFIAGGVVPGVLILKPDFPENKEDWPFFWGQNEYVVNLGANYIFLVHAADELVNR